MELSTKKYLYKLTINKKACGEVEIAAKCENRELIFYGKIVGNYDNITAFEHEKILNALELMFDEKVKRYDEKFGNIKEGLKNGKTNHNRTTKQLQ